MTQKTGFSVRDNVGIRREVEMEVGSSNGYASNVILDANATAKLIDDKIAAAAIPTKLSDLTNDVGFVTENNGQLQVNTTNISVISNQPFPSTWPIDNQHLLSDLVSAIDADADAIKGKVYLSTVHYTDLPASMADAELKIEVMDVRNNHKIAVFTITSANTSPYNWHATMWGGELTDWRSYALVEEEPGL